jgi:cytochrome P450
MRSLLQPHFTPRRMRALRPRVEALTTGLLDGLARRDPPADFIEALALAAGGLGVQPQQQSAVGRAARNRSSARGLRCLR